MKQTLKIVFAICLLTFGFSCKRQMNKTVQSNKQDSVLVAITDIVKIVPIIEKPTKIIVPVKNNDFKYFTAKSKFTFQDEKQQQAANLNIRIRKDSLIWLSVSLMGIEGGRGIITPQGCTFLDRINKQYYELDFASLSKQFNFNLDFGLIQAIMVGNMPFIQKESDENSKKEGHFLIHQHEKQLIIDNFIDENTQKIYQIDVSDASSENKLMLSYQQFQDIMGQLFPHQASTKISVVQNGQTKISTIVIDHQRIETTTQNPSFPFSIPSSYTKK